MFANVASKLQALGSWFRLRRKWIGVFLICLVVGGVAVTFFAPPAFAQTASSAGIISLDFWLNLFATVILAIAGLFIKLTIFVLTFIITLAGYNGYLDSTAVNVGWVMVRDFTNMGFVVILLVIAFGTILGSEQYEWKKLLGKFVFTAIIVNFSRTICGVIIDIGQIVMTTFVNGIAATAGGNLINAFQLNKILELADGVTPDKLTATAQFVAAVGGITFAAMVLGVMLAFLYMLIQRMVVLWVLIVLSPLAFVLSILPSTQSFPHKWWDQFIANVITGPVLLFFIWLSFVTLGSGDISSDIASHSTAPNRIDQDTSPGTGGLASGLQSAGISVIMTWSKMASFAIAIGMLMVGAKAASELGGMGADAVGSGLDFGKKVFGYASGLNAAKWTGSNVVAPAAKGIAMKFPVIGGENWQNLGKSIKGGLGVLKGVSDIARNKRVKAWEDKAAKDGGIYNNLKAYVGGAFWETAGRKAKRAEDWEKSAENVHEIVEETYSTSKSWGGKLKLLTGVKAHAAQKMAEKKKDEKYAKEEQRLIDEHDPEFHEYEHTAIEAQANAENIRKGLHRQEAVAIAQQRAALLREQGKNAEAAATVKSVYNHQFEEDQKEFLNMNQNEKVNEAVKIATETMALDAKLLAGTIKEEEEKKLKNLRRGAAQLLAASAKDGQQTYTAVMAAVLKKVRGNASMSAESSGQDILQAITGRSAITNAREFDVAHSLINDDKTFRNNDEAQAVLSLLSDATKSLAGKGEVRVAGAVEELSDDPAVLAANKIKPSQGAHTAFRLFNAYDSTRRQVGPNATDTAANLKSGMQSYFAPRVDFKQTDFIQGFGSTDDAGNSTSLDVDNLFEKMSKFKDTRDAASGFSSAFSDSTKDSKMVGAARADVITLLTKLKAHYTATGNVDIYNKIRDTVFSDWKGKGAP